MRIAPTNKAFDAYETMLAEYRARKATNEGAVRFAFQTLLTTLAPARWNVLGEQTMPSGIRMDGVIKDGYNLTRGYWEAKDTADDLDEEIRKKTAKGYPLTNIIFEDTRRAVLYQNKQQAMDVPLADRKQLAGLLEQYFAYEEPDIVAFERAVEEFKGQIPDLAAGRQLAELHLTYESAEPYPLDPIRTDGATLTNTFHVKRMKLTKDKSAVVVNPYLTLAGLPPETFHYRLGNRSALDWVLDQYRTGADARSGITSDPNRSDDPEYIVRLVGQVVTVSVATFGIVAALPPLPETPPV